MYTKIKVLLVSFIMVLIGVFTVTPANAVHPAAPYCGITWNSLVKVQPDTSPGDDFIYNVRSGRHDCFDRLVIDMGAAEDYRGYIVQYLPVVEDGSGKPVPLRGMDITIIVNSVNYDQNYGITYSVPNMKELVNVSNYRTFRQVAWAGSFEGQTTIGLGVRARLPMRAFVLEDKNNISRLVVDVAHKW